MKFPKTRQGKARRMTHPELFNPSNGEPHTRKWLDSNPIRRKRTRAISPFAKPDAEEPCK